MYTAIQCRKSRWDTLVLPSEMTKKIIFGDTNPCTIIWWAKYSSACRPFTKYANDLNGSEKGIRNSGPVYVFLVLTKRKRFFNWLKNKLLASYISPAASTLRFLMVLSAWICVILLGLVLTVLHRTAEHITGLSGWQGPTKSKTHKTARSERASPHPRESWGEAGSAPAVNTGIYACAHTHTHTLQELHMSLETLGRRVITSNPSHSDMLPGMESHSLENNWLSSELPRAPYVHQFRCQLWFPPGHMVQYMLLHRQTWAWKSFFKNYIFRHTYFYT